MTPRHRSILVGLFLLTPMPIAAQGVVEISLVHRPPPSVREREAVVVEGNMIGASEVESAQLFYRTDQALDWRNLELELVSGDHYRVEIPGSEVLQPVLEYYVVAIDFLENRYAAFASREHPAVVDVLPTRPEDRARRAEPEAASEPRTGPQRAPEPQPAPAQPAARPRPAARLAGRGRVAVVDGDDVEAMGARTLLDVLEIVPEVDVARSVSGFARVAIRGRRIDGDVLLSIDGHVMNNPWDGRAFFDLPADMIERVEVRKGPASGLEGEGALAGTIAVTTRSEVGRRFAAAVGSYMAHTTDDGATRRGSYIVAARGGVEKGPLRFATYGDVDVTDGTQATVRADAHSASATSSAPGPLDDGGLRAAGGGTLELEDAVPGRLELTGHYFYERRGAYLGLIDTYGPASKLSWHVGVLQARHELPLNDAVSLEYRVGVDVQRTDRSFQLTPPGFQLSDRDSDGQAEVFDDGVIEQTRMSTLGLVAEVESAIRLMPANSLRAGALVAHRLVMAPVVARNVEQTGVLQPLAEIESAAPAGGLTRTTVTARVEDDWAVHQNVDITFGFRLAYVSDAGGMEIAKRLNPRLGAVFRPIDAVAFELLYGSSFRPPTLAEQTDVAAASLPEPLRDDRVLGNASLGSAALHTVEAGGEYRGNVGGIGFWARGGAYYGRLVDGIEAVLGSGEVDAASGVSRVSQRPSVDQVGADVEARADFASRSSLSIGIWWLRAWDRAPEDDSLSLLTIVPQLGAALGLRLEIGELADVCLTARYGAQRRNNARTIAERLRTFRMPAQVVVNAAVRSRPLAERFRVGLNIHNAFDTARVDDVPRPDVVPGMLPREGFQILLTAEVVD